MATIGRNLGGDCHFVQPAIWQGAFRQPPLCNGDIEDARCRFSENAAGSFHGADRVNDDRTASTVATGLLALPDLILCLLRCCRLRNISLRSLDPWQFVANGVLSLKGATALGAPSTSAAPSPPSNNLVGSQRSTVKPAASGLQNCTTLLKRICQKALYCNKSSVSFASLPRLGPIQ